MRQVKIYVGETSNANPTAALVFDKETLVALLDIVPPIGFGTDRTEGFIRAAAEKALQVVNTLDS